MKSSIEVDQDSSTIGQRPNSPALDGRVVQGSVVKVHVGPTLAPPGVWDVTRH